MKKIRSPIVDGIFYPENDEALRSRVLKLLSDAPEPESPGAACVRGIIVPHAAYAFTGAVTACAFKTCKKREFKRIVLLGSVHREPAEEIYVTESEAFATPLGSIPVDTVKAEEFLSCSTSIIADDIPHFEEHCLEVHLPFIQLLFPDVPVLPVLLGSKTTGIVEACARAFRTAFLEDLDSTLFVVSSNAAAADTAGAAQTQAERFKQAAQTADWKALTDRQLLKKVSACGIACIAVLFHTQLAFTKLHLLSEAVSTEVEQDTKPIVHYVSYLVSEGGF